MWNVNSRRTATISTLALGAVICLMGLRADAAIIIGYDFNAASGTPSTVAANIDGNPLVFGPGTTSGSFPGTLAQAQGMNSTSQDLNDYFSVSFKPVSGYVVDLDSFVFDYRKGHANAPNSWAVRYSVDSFASNLSSGTQTETWQTATIPLTNSSLSGVIEFRIYGWAASASNRAMQLDNVIVNGTVNVIPEPASLSVLAMAAGALLMRRRV